MHRGKKYEFTVLQMAKDDRSFCWYWERANQTNDVVENDSAFRREGEILR